MVFYFTLASNPAVTCYMGRDKYENEDLIRWGWPEDLWFHVDSHSSAHVYVRLPVGQGWTWDNLTPEMLEECCQLVKANSIAGSKLNDVRVVYTPWTNLNKKGNMDVGQIGYHDPKMCRYHTIFKKDNKILNALEKTRTEKDFTTTQFKELREERDAEVSKAEKAKRLEEKLEEERQKKEEKERHDNKHYVKLMDEDTMASNKDAPMDEDDFM